METTEKRKKKRRKSGFLNYLMGGRFLVSDIFTKNALLLGLIVLYSFIYVSNRYAFQHEQLEIQHLRSQLNDMKYEALARSSELM